MIDTLRLTAKQANGLLTTGEASSDEIFSAYRAAIDECDKNGGNHVSPVGPLLLGVGNATGCSALAGQSPTSPATVISPRMA